MTRFVLTASEMRMAEDAAIADGTPVGALMERAGLAAAEAIWRFAGPLPTLILCGPGNNGGDGYVIARALRQRGVEVRVAAMGQPASDAAKAALSSWGAAVEPFGGNEPAPLLVDALFGTGLTRPLEDDASNLLLKLAEMAQVRVAVDLPSGVSTDDGVLLSPVPNHDLTITFQTLKPSHLLQPAARYMGRLVIADIGLITQSTLSEIGRPRLSRPGPDDHKYKRGHVAVIAGAMAGAAALAASAAAKSGAGYVSLLAAEPSAGVPRSVVQGKSDLEELLSDERVGAVVIGPGLGLDEDARLKLSQALKSGRALVLDADALTLLAQGTPGVLFGCPILTPHAGEFARLFPNLTGSKLEQARQAALMTQAVIVAKGADTVVASPDGRAAIARPAPSWLATAGTGDVLTGIVAALRASGIGSFEAACAAVWLHGRAAERAGAGLIADDLVEHLPDAFRDSL